MGLPTRRQRYLWGAAVDQILAEKEVDIGTADLVAWTLTDHLNTVRDIVKYDPQTGTTTVVNDLVYDAFGRVTSESNPAVDSLFLFTARPFDTDTGLQNNLHRWYDPRVGRWLSEDPIKADVNFYRYVGNNPTRCIDPSGLDAPGGSMWCEGYTKWVAERQKKEREARDREFEANAAKLRQQLRRCCSSQSDPCKKAQCEKDADAIIGGLRKAYHNIYDRGGPSYFSFNGPVCTQCEEQVCHNLRNGTYFAYTTVTHIGPTIPGTDISVPFTDHAWGEIKCMATGQVYTIDFWKGGTDFWRYGPDAFGWKRTTCSPPTTTRPNMPSHPVGPGPYIGPFNLY